jgi:hypothetical protein
LINPNPICVLKLIDVPALADATARAFAADGLYLKNELRPTRLARHPDIVGAAMLVPDLLLYDVVVFALHDVWM